MTEITITERELMAVLQEQRLMLGRKRYVNDMRLYKKGEDVQKVGKAYMKVISVSGSTLNKVEKTIMVIVKYHTKKNELCSVSIPYKYVYDSIPRIRSVPLPKE